MTPEHSTKGVRKGTKSCVECRQRKVRCVWHSERTDSCQSCFSRSLVCERQIHMTPTSETVRVTSGARIRELQSEVSSLWNAVHHLEAKLGCVPTQVATHARRPSQIQESHDFQEKQSDGDSDSDVSDAVPTSPPGHLLQLFDNNLLGSDGYESNTPSRHGTSLHSIHAVSTLRALMPSREDMLTITAHASSWLPLYNEVFPVINIMKTGDEMLSQYDTLQLANADLLEMAAFLLSVALTVQQAPDDTAGRAAKSIRDAPSFIRNVSDTVERIVVSDDALAGTLEGIEVSLVFLRLQLGRAKVRKMWLLTRRIIALAELIGLPRASMTATTNDESPRSTFRGAYSKASPLLIGSWRHKAELWESICTVDRVASIMWSLPLATLNYPLPERSIVDSQGQIIPQFYLHSLVNIASRVLELDTIASSGRPLLELFNAVISTDQKLRTLASLAPKGWRKIDWPELSDALPLDPILQYWHQYLLVRIHLQLALRYDEGQEFAFNFITCLEACQELVRRYISMRPILPCGFFANRVIDLQAFTGTVFLLLATYRTARGSGTFNHAVDLNITTSLVDQVVRVMSHVATRARGDFARQAVDAIRSLTSLLQQSQTSEPQTITLNLALVGKLHISRKSHATQTPSKQPYSTPAQQLQAPWHTVTSSDVPIPITQLSKALDIDMMDSLSYSMEIPESYPFFTDDTLGNEQWFTWKN